MWWNMITFMLRNKPHSFLLLTCCFSCKHAHAHTYGDGYTLLVVIVTETRTTINIGRLLIAQWAEITRQITFWCVTHQVTNSNSGRFTRIVWRLVVPSLFMRQSCSCGMWSAVLRWGQRCIWDVNTRYLSEATTMSVIWRSIWKAYLFWL